MCPQTAVPGTRSPWAALLRRALASPRRKRRSGATEQHTNTSSSFWPLPRTKPVSGRQARLDGEQASTLSCCSSYSHIYLSIYLHFALPEHETVITPSVERWKGARPAQTCFGSRPLTVMSIRKVLIRAGITTQPHRTLFALGQTAASYGTNSIPYETMSSLCKAMFAGIGLDPYKYPLPACGRHLSGEVGTWIDV